MLSPDKTQQAIESIIGATYDKGYENGYKAAMEDVAQVMDRAIMDMLDEKDTKPC